MSHVSVAILKWAANMTSKRKNSEISQENQRKTMTPKNKNIKTGHKYSYMTGKDPRQIFDKLLDKEQIDETRKYIELKANL